MVAAAPRSPRSPRSPNSRATRPKTRGTTAQVSSLGRVRTKNGKVVTPNPGASGYCRFKFNSKKNLPVHRLVAFLFLGRPERPDQTQVDHIDGDRSNNRVENLEWASGQENVRHSHRTNLARGTNAAQLSQAVEALGAAGAVVARYPSLKAAAEALEVRFQNISKCLADDSKKCRGFQFRRVVEADEEGEVWKDIPEDIVSLLDGLS